MRMMKTEKMRQIRMRKKMAEKMRIMRRTMTRMKITCQTMKERLIHRKKRKIRRRG
jgi:hypothetical protein